MPLTNHILPVSTLEWTSVCLLMTWPYHRTLRYFTLMPAQRLAATWDKGTHAELQDELRHWTGLKSLELTFVSRAVSEISCRSMLESWRSSKVIGQVGADRWVVW